MAYELERYVTAARIAELVRRKEISPVEVLEATLAAIERLQPALNCFHTLAPEQALEAARDAEAAVLRGDELGPLHGVPVGIKDLTPTAGIRTTYGSKLFRDYVPLEDALSVQRLRRAGAIVIGKTSTPEFGHKGLTESDLFGITRNPWDPSRTPGGSSGGSAAAVAAGMLPIAHGTDGAGSIRIPSSFCGVAGLKPTFARVARYPQPDAYQTNSHEGPIARTIEDIALMLEALSGEDPRDPASFGQRPFDRAAALEENLPGLRIGYSPNLRHADVAPEVRDIVGDAVLAWAELGCSVDDVVPGWDDPAPLAIAVFSAGLLRILDGQPENVLDLVDASLRPSLELALSYTAEELVRASLGRTALFNSVNSLFEQVDLLVTPTCPIPAHAIGDSAPAIIDGTSAGRGAVIKLVSLFNLTGNPAISIPAGWTAAGLPVGMQIVGRRGEDELVVRAAAAFERARPWAHRRPPV